MRACCLLPWLGPMHPRKALSSRERQPAKAWLRNARSRCRWRRAKQARRHQRPPREWPKEALHLPCVVVRKWRWKQLLIDSRSAGSSASEETTSDAVTTILLPAVEESRRVVQPEKNTRFFVTLDGAVDRFGNGGLALIEGEHGGSEEVTSARPASVKRPAREFVDDVGEEEAGGEAQESYEPPAKAPRNPERCHYWPKCTAGQSCRYYHPTHPCKNFPKCKFGKKCLFVHPDCKFDGFCNRSDCPFLHRKTQAPSVPVPVPMPVMSPPPVPVQAAMSPIECKFHPKCTRPDCPFYHPKPCRFGSNCTRRDCKFTHPSTSPAIPRRSQLSWSKKTHVSDRHFAFDEPATSMPV